ncbi:hypothetical protein CYMTET_29471 [Cymbomonas tetramitiformis]|uniref:EGF-like domain-containing protein n=1 Tax=Cymbomonas tetramitiformis TaxID=36881 RepID=A0AAE0FL52_9CHLO|nr:hypothetical protein CYMTET_29471 [Cymbomonas tetramitiformis]
MSAEAGVSSDLVIISSIAAGSVQVLSTVYFPGNFPSADPAAFSSTLTSSPTSIFTSGSYGTVASASVSTGSASVVYSPPPPPNSPTTSLPHLLRLLHHRLLTSSSFSPPPPHRRLSFTTASFTSTSFTTASPSSPLFLHLRFSFITAPSPPPSLPSSRFLLHHRSLLHQPPSPTAPSPSPLPPPEGTPGSADSSDSSSMARSGIDCVDEDECSDGTLTNGGCDPKTACTNTVGGRECSDCPAGYLGDGESGCRPQGASCAEDNGGCDALTTCTEVEGEAAACSECPPGYAGTGATACTDLDGCGVMPCFPGTVCADVAAPGVGFTCGECPSGFWGDGVNCERNLCEADPPPCSELGSCTTTPGGGYTCGACPSGYEGDGTTCDDVNECERSDNGGCDIRTVCTNMPGGRECGECPATFLGSGYTQCVPSSSCDTNNGGCDALTDCTDTESGEPSCGDCPVGYTGTGSTGCVDVNGCAEAAAEAEGCYPGVFCADVPAPASGFTCGACPVGMEGDGITCWENLCFNANGGCDARVSCTNTPDQTPARVCGGCPAGHVDVFQDGTSCVEEDGCAADACFPGVECTDVGAPGVGATCGECPAGYVAAAPAATPACVDVDECQEGNGGCDVQTQCENIPGGHSCGACPAGFMGTGEAGCRRTQTCENDNGGCHTLTLCTDTETAVECGACPAGYEGSGDTTCEDADGCAPSPCFPGVQCADVAAPGEGYTCAACPEGYKGDGETCDKCVLGMAIVSSTVVDGKVKRAYQNQVVAELAGLEDPQCVPSTETTFQWAGSTSDGAVLALTDEVNRASTLRLNFPKSTLTTYLSYTLSLTAKVTASPEVRAETSLSFFVEPQNLVALVSPSELATGEDSQVLLDAGASYDPDGEPDALRFEWRCTRADGADNCRDRDGNLLPATWATASIEISLEGNPEGRLYTFTVQIFKGQRESTATAMVTMTSGALPVPAIAALPGKVNMNDKMTLTSTVESTAPEALARAWTVIPEEGTDPLDLAAAAATALTTADLVVRAGTLMCGGAYIFRLAVEDSVGLASTSMRVVVNSPPSSGALTVTPAEGIVLETLFQASATDWQDEDAPLWYQLKYEVVGAGGGLEMLTEYQPQPTAETMLAEEGLSAHDSAVQVFVLVRDALGAVATSAGVTVAVNPVVVEGSELTAYVDNMMAISATSMANGNTDEAMLLVDGMAKTMNSAAEQRRRRRRHRVLLQEVTEEEAETEDAETVGKAQEQREVMLDILGSAQAAVAASDSSLQRLASSVSNVVTEPEETGGPQQDSAFGLLENIVAEAENPASEASITTDTSRALGTGLSSLVAAGVVNPSSDPAAPNPAARGLGTLSAMAGTLTAGMVAGEDAATMASDVLTMRTQQEDLSDPNSRAFAAPLDTPGGLSSVSFPASLGKELARRRRNLMSETGGNTAINLFTSTVDPHANLTADSNATRALRRALLQALHEDDEAAPEAASVSAVVTSIGLSVGGGEVVVSGLEVGITFTLPLAEGGAGEGGGNRSAPPQCAFYDEVNATYSREGCGSLPTPAPPGVRLQWRTRNASEAEGHIERMWEVENASSSRWFLSGCDESFEAVFPEYLGTDAGLRKYLGDGCVAADPENNASCWWEWESQAFVGAGCEWGSHLHCLCTHLTDFKATQDQELGSAEPPKGSFISTEDMTALSASDMMKSALLLGILGGLMGGAILLAQLSDYVHANEKEGVFRELLKSHGTEHLWFQYAAQTVWTWSFTGPLRRLRLTRGTCCEVKRALWMLSQDSRPHPGVSSLVFPLLQAELPLSPPAALQRQ